MMKKKEIPKRKDNEEDSKVIIDTLAKLKHKTVNEKIDIALKGLLNVPPQQKEK